MRALLLIVLLSLLPHPTIVQAADHSTSAAEQSNQQRRERIRERIRKQNEAILERERQSVKDAEKFMEDTREANSEAIEGGTERVEDYANNNTVSNYPNTEVRVQETWVWDEELGDQRLEWQYRLVYKDSFGNAQYEAYFDQNGNVTTALRESPWRVANQRVDKEMGDDSGPFQVVWKFSEDNQGREYPDSVIVQGGGAINRVQMQFNENGHAYFWDIRDEDGETKSRGHGLLTPTFVDDGPALATVEVPRPITGPCEKCRDLLNARNDLVGPLAPLAKRINKLAGRHAVLNKWAAENKYHVQDFDRIRTEHASKLIRYRTLKSRFDTADAAWRACEETCKDAIAANSASDLNALPSPLLVNVTQDSPKICTFGDPNGTSPHEATPVTAGSSAPASEENGTPDSAGGSTPAGGSRTPNSSGSANAPGSSGSSAGGSPAAPTGNSSASSTSSSGSENGENNGSTASSGGGSSPTQDSSGGPNVPASDREENDSEKDEGKGSSARGGGVYTGSVEDDSGIEDLPQKERMTINPLTILIVKANAATMAAGANISGKSGQLVALQPQSVNNAALPTDSCSSASGSECDWWKMEESCGDSWYCDAGLELDDECSGNDCDYVADTDCEPGHVCDIQNCPSSGCPTGQGPCDIQRCPSNCSGDHCGWDAGFDQDPVKCELDSSGSCSMSINAEQQAAGSYYVVVDSWASSEPNYYELEIDAVNSEGITVKGDANAIDQLPPQYLHYAQSPITINGESWFTMLYPSHEAEAIRDALAALFGVDAIDIDPCWIKWEAPNDPYYQSSNTWGQGYADQWALHKVGFAPKGKNAWDLLDEDGAEVIVAIIDTGIDWNHRDLAWRNIWLNKKEIADNGKDDDGNGFVDDRIGWDFWADDNRPWDEDGHGTLLAGIIAARADNNTGIAGINPKARIMPLRALNAFGHTRASYVARALVYAVDNGARVVNLSVGGTGESQLFRAAVDYAESKGVLVVAAAGNEAAELQNILPGAHPAVFTVAALDPQDKRAAFSNYGAEVDIAAPGVDILSLRARFTDTMLGLGDIEYTPGQATVGEDKRYYRVGGTSFASPFVTGIASLLLSKDPSLQAADLRRILRQSAKDVGEPGWDQLTGYGRVDAYSALKADQDYFIEARIHGFTVEQRNGETLLVVSGIANANKFASAEVMLGPGDEPQRWRRVATLKKGQADGELAEIPASVLQGGPKTFTVRLIVKHRDGSSREIRFGLELG